MVLFCLKNGPTEVNSSVLFIIQALSYSCFIIFRLLFQIMNSIHFTREVFQMRRNWCTLKLRMNSFLVVTFNSRDAFTNEKSKRWKDVVLFFF